MLRVERTETGVGRIVLDRPDAHNALTIEMRDGIIDGLRELRAAPDVRAVLITGTGGAFCAGMDLSASTVAQAGKPGFSPRSTSEALRIGVQTFIRELWELDKPTVAAVDGVAIGPGAHLALACDFVLVQPNSRFMWTFPKWGLVVDAGGAYLLPRLVGMARAKAMVLLGEGATGAEAVELGLAYKCVEQGELHVTAEALVEQLATGPTRSLGLSKRLLNGTFERGLNDLLELEAYLQALATTSPDIIEGMAAFRDKRDADFTGQ